MTTKEKFSKLPMIGALLFILLLPFGTVSCNNDKDDEPEEEPPTLIGTWTQNASLLLGGGETTIYLSNGEEESIINTPETKEGLVTVEFLSSNVCSVSYLDLKIGYYYHMVDDVITFENSYNERCTYKISYDKSNLSMTKISGDTEFGEIDIIYRHYNPEEVLEKMTIERNRIGSDLIFSRTK